jgi:hypothetical protein
MATATTNGRTRGSAPAPTVDEQIAQLVAEIRQTVDEIERLDDAVQAAKDRLRILLTQRGENWTDDDGYARLTSDSTRASYDSHALDQLILSDPAAHGWLKDYRRSFAVRGSVVVK